MSGWRSHGLPCVCLQLEVRLLHHRLPDGTGCAVRCEYTGSATCCLPAGACRRAEWCQTSPVPPSQRAFPQLSVCPLHSALGRRKPVRGAYFENSSSNPRGLLFSRHSRRQLGLCENILWGRRCDTYLRWKLRGLLKERASGFLGSTDCDLMIGLVFFFLLEV